MNLTIQRNLFFEALQKLQPVVEKKTQFPILNHILCVASGTTLSLCATDLEMGIEIKLPVQVTLEGKITLSAKTLFEIVRELPELPLHINRKENHWIELKCGKAKFNIVSLAAEEFPSFPSFDSKNYFETSASSFLNMIKRTEFAISLDSTRINLSGVCFEHLGNSLMRMVATDGHRLSFVDQEVFLSMPDLKKNIVIPKKGLKELGNVLSESSNKTNDLESPLDSSNSTVQRSSPFLLAVDQGLLYVKQASWQMFMRLIEGEYPDYRMVLPTNLDRFAIMNRVDLISALKRMSLIANEKTRSVRLGFQPKLLTVESSNSELGEGYEEIDLEYPHEPMDVVFNSSFLLDCLEVMKSDQVQFNFKDRKSATIIKASGEPYHTYVIMPMRA